MAKTLRLVHRTLPTDYGSTSVVVRCLAHSWTPAMERCVSLWTRTQFRASRLVPDSSTNLHRGLPESCQQSALTGKSTYVRACPHSTFPHGAAPQSFLHSVCNCLGDSTWGAGGGEVPLLAIDIYRSPDQNICPVRVRSSNQAVRSCGTENIPRKVIVYHCN